MRYLYSILILTVFSCATTGKLEYPHSYSERRLSFFDPYEQTWIDEKNVGYVYDHWIREPENIKMLHETFKKIGYKKLITERQRYSSVVANGIFIRKPLNELLDSLIITYNQDTITSRYYREFWSRRAFENNREIVYEVLTELTAELYEDHKVEPNHKFVNDTLYNLIQMRELSDTITLEKARKQFEYLRQIGMHQSAYNLLFERYGYSRLDWNTDELLEQLAIDTVNCCPNPWMRDNTK